MDTQTDPFTPEYTLREDDPNPMVLALADMHFETGENGGRIGLDEIKFIDKTRRRRQVEENLPSGTEKEQFDKRVQMLKELEMKEWEEREEEIQKQQDAEMEILERILRQREHDREQRNRKKLEKRKAGVEEEVRAKMNKFERQRHQAIRKNTKKYDNPENLKSVRDILKEYTQFGSKTYAPMVRDGKLDDLTPIAYEIRPALLTDPLGIDEVEQAQLQKMLKQDHERIVKEDPKKTSSDRKKQEIVEHVAIAKEEIERQKNAQGNTSNAKKIQNLHELYKATPRVVRPPTPNLEYDEIDDEQEMAVLLMQRLLRGRAAQNEFFEGKERSLELIKELQAVEETKQLEKLHEKQHAVPHKPPISQIVDAIQGKLVARTLDYLAKELIRQEEMQKVEKLRAYAEHERHRREKQELERREQEEDLRTREEEQYRQVIETDNDTISTFIYDIYEETPQRLAYVQSLKQVYDETLQSKDSSTNDEQEIRELVASFVLPQVKRSIIKNKIQNNQMKYIESAHDLLSNVQLK
jgi:hypothetical protein